MRQKSPPPMSPCVTAALGPFLEGGMADCCGRIWRLPTLGARCRTRILEAMVLKLKNGSIVHVFFSLQLSVLCCPKNMVRGCVSRASNQATFVHVFWPAKYVGLTTK